jgi:hypothetical protein
MIITEKIIKWIKCSHNAWSNCFLENMDNRFEFHIIENAYLELIVLDPLNIKKEQYNAHIFAKYKKDIQDIRVVCKKQKAGNIFCKSKKIFINSNSYYKVKSIDTIGELFDNTPYVEVSISENEYFMETSFDSLMEFAIIAHASPDKFKLHEGAISE